jgi:hypothetical protein
VFLYAFDLIELNGDDLRRDPLEVRKATLRGMLARHCATPGAPRPARCPTEPTGLKSSQDSIHPWMKVGAQVSRADRNWLEKAQQPGLRMGSSLKCSRLKLTVVRKIMAGQWADPIRGIPC